RYGDKGQPFGLAQEVGEVRGQWSGSGGNGVGCFGYAHPYSGSMIDSRSTIEEPRISMKPPSCRSFITRLTISREAPIILAMSCLGSRLVTTFSPLTVSDMSSRSRATRP